MDLVDLATASGGSYTLSYNGQTTAAIAYNASTLTIQADLSNLSSLGPVAQPSIVELTFSTGTSSGTFSLSADSQTTAAISYPRATPAAGSSATPTAMSNSGSTVTVTAAGTYVVGEAITMTGVTPAGFNGTYLVSAVGTGTFAYVDGGTLGAVTAFGSATVGLAPEIQYNLQQLSNLGTNVTVSGTGGPTGSGGGTVNIFVTFSGATSNTNSIGINAGTLNYGTIGQSSFQYGTASNIVVTGASPIYYIQFQGTLGGGLTPVLGFDPTNGGSGGLTFPASYVGKSFDTIDTPGLIFEPQESGTLYLTDGANINNTTYASVVKTGVNRMILGGNVFVESQPGETSTNGVGSLISGNIALLSPVAGLAPMRTFTVADSTAANDLTLTANVYDGGPYASGITKTGAVQYLTPYGGIGSGQNSVNVASRMYVNSPSMLTPA